MVIDEKDVTIIAMSMTRTDRTNKNKGHKLPLSCKLLDFLSSLDYQMVVALSMAKQKKFKKISHDSSLEVKVILFLSSQ